MKRLIVAVVIGSVILASAVPALANTVGAPPANKLGPVVSWAAQNFPPLGQIVSEEAQAHTVASEILDLMGLTPPGMD